MPRATRRSRSSLIRGAAVFWLRFPFEPDADNSPDQRTSPRTLERGHANESSVTSSIVSPQIATSEPNKLLSCSLVSPDDGWYE